MSDQGAEAKKQLGLSIPMRQEIAAGIFLMLIGLFFVWQSSDLPMGTLRAVGPGMLPRAVAVMLVVGGLKTREEAEQYAKGLAEFLGESANAWFERVQ